MKLAYLCHSNTTAVRPGDLLLFYRSNDVQAITTVGVVETSQRLNTANDILKLVLKRTVYTAQQIQTLASKETLVILFRLSQHMKVPVDKKALADIGICGNIQSIRRITDDQFWHIVEEGSIQDCFLAD